MNINDLKQDSYTVVSQPQTGKLNIANLNQNDYSIVEQQPVKQPIEFGGKYVSNIAEEQTKGIKHIGESIKKGAVDVQAGMETGGFKGIPQTLKGLATSAFGATSGALQAGFAPVTAAVGPVIKAEVPIILKALKIAHPTLYKAVEKIAPDVQEAVLPQIQQLIEKYPDATSLTGDIVNTLLGAAGGEVNLTKLVKGAGEAVAPSVLKKTGGEILDASGNVIKSTAKAVTPESASIMNRVARLSPTESATFEKMAGMSHGEYLTKTGNFNNPETIIRNEAEKFIASKNEVDTALSQLPGEYKTGAIDDVLEGIISRAKETSGTNVKSPYLDRALELKVKHDTKGLTMSEINEAKRLYEKNVKLGHNKFNNPVAVEKATNIDNAVREWQVKKADELGFSNIKDINQQTRLSKYLVDKLGKKLAGESGNNALSLTDWIMLSGGEPSSVAGLLTKKIFSNKSVQSRIAKMLAGEPTIPFIKADITGAKLK